MNPVKLLDYLARASKKNPVAKRAFKRFKGIGDDAANYTDKQLKSLEKAVNKVRGMNPEGQKAPTDVVGRAARLYRKANPQQKRIEDLNKYQRHYDKLKVAGATASGGIAGAGAVSAKAAYNKGKEKNQGLNITGEELKIIEDNTKNPAKKSYGGKVTRRKAGGKIGRGCGAALRGGGKVMR